MQLAGSYSVAEILWRSLDSARQDAVWLFAVNKFRLNIRNELTAIDSHVYVSLNQSV